jgi:predicted methyltransferase
MTTAAGLTLLVLTTLLAGGCAGVTPRAMVAQRIDVQLAGAHRSDAERGRDKYRHPRETLLFFGLRPDQTVVEVLPIGGWYTKVIAPVLREQGRYFAAMPPVVDGNANSARGRKAYMDLLAGTPALLDRVQVVDFDPGTPGSVPDGSADLVLTFRNVHNWMGRDRAVPAFQEMFRMLKPGGTLGVVEHRGNEAIPQDPRAASGYVNQSHAIRLIESAGFRLVATSEINANPKDSRDHPGGVWNLPPVLSAGDKDRDRFVAIGESDRFTLKFIKPR